MFDNNFNIFLPEPVLLYDGSKQVSSLFTCKGVHLLHSIHDPDYLDTLEEFKMEDYGVVGSPARSDAGLLRMLPVVKASRRVK